MIIVKRAPVIVPSEACPGTTVKFVGVNGYYYHVYSIDMSTGQVLDGGKTQITSDPYEALVFWPTAGQSGYRTIYAACIDVEDANGNKVETWKAFFIYAPGIQSVAIPQSDVIYITKTGVIKWFKNATSAYIDQQNYMFTIIRRPGYVAIYEGSTLKTEYSGKAAIFELQFKVSADLANLMANMIDDQSVLDVVYKVPDLGGWMGAVAYINRVAAEMRITNVGTSVTRNSDGSYTVTARMQVDLYSQIDWQRLIHLLAGVGSVIGGVLLLIASGGFSAPVSWTMIAGGLTFIAAGIISLYDTSYNAPTYVKEQAALTVQKATNEINTYVGSLTDYLNQLLSQGKITQDDYNTIMNYVNGVVNAAKEGMSELQNLVDKAFQEGYNKAKNEMMTWLVLAGVGGFVAGQMVAPRIIERVVQAAPATTAG
jgi:hypothetical protein